MFLISGFVLRVTEDSLGNRISLKSGLFSREIYLKKSPLWWQKQKGAV
jgi:hypothetical protein